MYYKEVHNLLRRDNEALRLLEKSRRNRFCNLVIAVVLSLVIFILSFLGLKDILSQGFCNLCKYGLFLLLVLYASSSLMLMTISILDNPVLSYIELEYINSALKEYKEVCNNGSVILLKEGDKYYIYDSIKNKILETVKSDSETSRKEYTLDIYKYFKLSEKGRISDYFEYLVRPKN